MSTDTWSILYRYNNDDIKSLTEWRKNKGHAQNISDDFQLSKKCILHTDTGMYQCKIQQGAKKGAVKMEEDMDDKYQLSDKCEKHLVVEKNGQGKEPNDEAEGNDSNINEHAFKLKNNSKFIKNRNGQIHKIVNKSKSDYLSYKLKNNLSLVGNFVNHEKTVLHNNSYQHTNSFHRNNAYRCINSVHHNNGGYNQLYTLTNEDMKHFLDESSQLLPEIRRYTLNNTLDENISKDQSKEKCLIRNVTNMGSIRGENEVLNMSFPRGVEKKMFTLTKEKESDECEGETSNEHFHLCVDERSNNELFEDISKSNNYFEKVGKDSPGYINGERNLNEKKNRIIVKESKLFIRQEHGTSELTKEKHTTIDNITGKKNNLMNEENEITCISYVKERDRSRRRAVMMDKEIQQNTDRGSLSQSDHSDLKKKNFHFSGRKKKGGNTEKGKKSINYKSIYKNVREKLVVHQNNTMLDHHKWLQKCPHVDVNHFRIPNEDLYKKENIKDVSREVLSMISNEMHDYTTETWKPINRHSNCSSAMNSRDENTNMRNSSSGTFEHTGRRSSKGKSSNGKYGFNEKHISKSNLGMEKNAKLNNPFDDSNGTTFGANDSFLLTMAEEKKCHYNTRNAHTSNNFFEKYKSVQFCDSLENSHFWKKHILEVLKKSAKGEKKMEKEMEKQMEKKMEKKIEKKMEKKKEKKMEKKKEKKMEKKKEKKMGKKNGNHIGEKKFMCKITCNALKAKIPYVTQTNSTDANSLTNFVPKSIGSIESVTTKGKSADIACGVRTRNPINGHAGSATRRDNDNKGEHNYSRARTQHINNCLDIICSGNASLGCDKGEKKKRHDGKGGEFAGKSNVLICDKRGSWCSTKMSDIENHNSVCNFNHNNGRSSNSSRNGRSSNSSSNGRSNNSDKIRNNSSGSLFLSEPLLNADEKEGASNPSVDVFFPHVSPIINSKNSYNMLTKSNNSKIVINEKIKINYPDGRPITQCNGNGKFLQGDEVKKGDSQMKHGNDCINNMVSGSVKASVTIKIGHNKFVKDYDEDCTIEDIRNDSSEDYSHDKYAFSAHTEELGGDEPNCINNHVNLPSNDKDALNSFDVTCEDCRDVNGNQMEDIFSSNDILVKDIEEIKMNKMFFEEICIFRIHEKNDENSESSGRKEQKNNPFEYHLEGHGARILHHKHSIQDVDITKLVLNKNCYEQINHEVQNLMKEEDTYEIEMNVGLVFRKYISIVINLACNYLLIKKNEKNIITCIPYSNILEVSIIKRSKKKKDRYLFKLVYVFKKKEQYEKNVTLLFRSNRMEVFEKINSKVEPNSVERKDPRCKEYLDIESVYSYMVEKHKKAYLLYLKHLLHITERVCRRHILKYAFIELKKKCDHEKKIQQMKKERDKAVQNVADKLDFWMKKRLQTYFNVLVIKSYETSFINYQVKTNNMLFNMLVKEKSSYQEIVERQSFLLLFHVLSNMYKRKMSKYFRCFVNNNRTLSRRKNAVCYSLTRVNGIMLNYERRIKCHVISKLKFNYDYVTYFVFVMYKIYMRRVFLGYIHLRDNKNGKKIVIEKSVYKMIKVLSKMVESQKFYAFLKLQKYIFHEMDRKNKLICNRLMYTNNELCQNLDKVAIEKGINKVESFYKFKMKEYLLKYFYILKGPQAANIIQFKNRSLKYCGIFSFILNKIIQKKVQDLFFIFVLKCYQTNNKNRLLYAMKYLNQILEKKEKTNVMNLLQMYDTYPCLFQYRHLTKIEIFAKSVDNFITFCNKKLLLNFLLKLQHLKYQERFIKAYKCIESLYKIIRIVNKEINSRMQMSFQLLLQNANKKNNDILKEKILKTNKKKTQLKFNYKKALSSPAPFLDSKKECLFYHLDLPLPSTSDSLSLFKRYPYLFYNSDISPERTTMADMDKIKRKICDFNNRMSNVKL
ncbi:hypothetical protein, conserved [Plasmodium gonderi]|uniref:Uncharacterized protein n=1 Tax=Plasmodium gonderi TaxID=77519 RepID=A0A1Y1JGH9_PLAGO|nr:hypothetical protein, conserved [Plasmodium gonderi]GAW79543.1 hypothetical protein, conserved [Plasmodium gonderi]